VEIRYNPRVLPVWLFVAGVAIPYKLANSGSANVPVAPSGGVPQMVLPGPRREGALQGIQDCQLGEK